MSPVPTRSTGLIRLAVIAIAVLAVTGVVLLVWAATQIQPQPIAPTPSPSAPQLTDVPVGPRLLVQDRDTIYSLNSDGSQRLAFEPRGSLPTAALIWQRDGARILYSQEVGNQSQLISANVDGTDERILFEGRRPQAPFYLYGAPDDEHVAFLITDPLNGIELQVAENDRAGSAQPIEQGQPNYAAWSPDSRSLLLHIGGSEPDAFIGTYALADEQLTRLTAVPAEFQAPVWSSATRRLYAQREQGQSYLVADDGQTQHRLAEFENGLTFSDAPDGRHVAYAFNNPTSFVYESLTIATAQGEEARVIHDGNLLGFFWSPDGTRLAYLTSRVLPQGPIGRGPGLAAPRQQLDVRSLQVTWRVYDLASAETSLLTTFQPTAAFLYMLQFFDQFAQSIAVWSPDSRALVFTGTPLVGEPGVYVIDIAADEPRYLGPGDFAIWSWK